MNVHSYTIIHYGKDYIDYALRSVRPLVEQSHVIYTDHPSHGHQPPDLSPIETFEDIQQAVTPDPKVRWYALDRIYHEGRQRDSAVKTCVKAGAEMILVVDCDEVWPEKTLAAALSYAWHENRARNWLINFTHLWRSFNWCCRDEGWPVRIIDLRHDEGTAYIPKEFGEIYHFGYAVTDKVMRYKWKIHGHKSELRDGWFPLKWDAWPPPKDCHPTNEKDFWTPEPFDKNLMPTLMKGHKFYDCEQIK